MKDQLSSTWKSKYKNVASIDSSYETNSLQSTTIVNWMRSYLKELSAFAKTYHLNSILDVGSNTGQLLSECSDTIFNLRMGIDYEESFVDIARKKFPHIVFQTGNIYDLQKTVTVKFDSIICFGVFQNLEFPELALKELLNTLSDKPQSKISIICRVSNPIFDNKIMIKILNLMLKNNNPELKTYSISDFEEMTKRTNSRLAHYRLFSIAPLRLSPTHLLIEIQKNA